MDNIGTKLCYPIWILQTPNQKCRYPNNLTFKDKNPIPQKKTYLFLWVLNKPNQKFNQLFPDDLG